MTSSVRPSPVSRPSTVALFCSARDHLRRSNKPSQALRCNTLAIRILLIPLLLGNLVLAAIDISRRNLFFHITVLDPITIFASVLGLLVVPYRTLRTPPQQLLPLCLLLLLWVPIIAGRSYIWGFTLARQICISTPWLETSLVRNECMRVATAFFSAVAVAFVYLGNTIVNCLAKRSVGGKRWRGESVWEKSCAHTADESDVENFENDSNRDSINSRISTDQLLPHAAARGR